MRSGVPPESKCIVVPSPFIHDQAASLVIPAMGSDPRNSEEHTGEIVDMLPELLKDVQGALVLFSSRRQMKDVHYGLSKIWAGQSAATG